MSESTSASMSEKRPWHDGDNPWESIYQHFTAEIAALRKELSGQTVFLPPFAAIPVPADAFVEEKPSILRPLR